jgi:hypothetical protein
MSSSSILTMACLLASLLAGAAVVTAADWNLTASYSCIQSKGKLLGTEVVHLPGRYINFDDYLTAAGYFGNLSGWATAPGMPEKLLVAVMGMIVLSIVVNTASRIAELTKRSAEHEAAMAALKVQHKQELQQLRSEIAEAEQTAAAAAAARENAAARAAEPHPDAVQLAAWTDAVRQAFTDLRLLNAEAPGTMVTPALQAVKRRNACLADIPTQSNQHVRRTREAVHDALRARLGEWLEAQLLLTGWPAMITEQQQADLLASVSSLDNFLPCNVTAATA